VRERAARLVRLTYAPGVATDPAQLERTEANLRELGVVGVHRTAATFTVELYSADPRPFLAALGQQPALPAPIAIEYGEVSLADLYSGIYGVEAW